jgi:hypothetical protein
MIQSSIVFKGNLQLMIAFPISAVFPVVCMLGYVMPQVASLA